MLRELQWRAWLQNRLYTENYLIRDSYSRNRESTPQVLERFTLTRAVVLELLYRVGITLEELPTYNTSVY